MKDKFAKMRVEKIKYVSCTWTRPRLMQLIMILSQQVIDKPHD